MIPDLKDMLPRLCYLHKIPGMKGEKEDVYFYNSIHLYSHFWCCNFLQTLKVFWEIHGNATRSEKRRSMA